LNRRLVKGDRHARTSTGHWIHGVLEPIFTKPAFIICIRLVAGWILCPARRAITGMYPFADPKRENRVDVHHYFFRAASWLQCELFACWARFLVGRLCAGRKTPLLAIDDTVHKKTGRKVDVARVCRDPIGKEADDFFFSTDTTDSPALSVSDFSDRWAVEDTFRNVKQYLEAEQPQSWKDIAPERAGAFSYLLYGAVWLVRIEREGEKTAAIQREWYSEKDCVSFLDALADVRKQLWDERIIAMSSSRANLTVIQKLLVNALAWAA
jgi:hypothetical protein